MCVSRAVLSDDSVCAGCHTYKDVEGGAALDLNGYMSREWLAAFIANPDHDRFYMGNNDRMPAFAENEAESPWPPYHVRRGFAADDSVVTAMAAEGPHNINDHGSTTGEGLLTTIAGTIAQPGANTIYGIGPYFVVIGPEHAQTLHRDGFTVASIQAHLFEHARVHVSRVSQENQASYADMGHAPDNDYYAVCRSPEDIHIVVAGGPGKHSAFIPSFGGTAAVSQRVTGA